MQWVEVRGKTIEVAVEAAMRELGIDDRDRLEIEVIQQPERGFLGLGGKDAIVRVKPKPARKRRRRRRKGKGEHAATQRGRGRENRKPRRERNGARPARSEPKEKEAATVEEREVTIEEQTRVVEEFLRGLVDAFGLEGEVKTRLEDDVIVVDVIGPQTEAMVGPRGSVIEAIHELTKTVLQRRTQTAPRVRLDIAGYAERRRQALTIYANQLIDQVLEEGGEIMLEPMSAADRKVIHDAVAAREGVRSYSEGEAPQRYVVIAKVEEDSEDSAAAEEE